MGEICPSAKVATSPHFLFRCYSNPVPHTSALKREGFTNLQRRLVKIAGRVIETAMRICIAFVAVWQTFYNHSEIKPQITLKLKQYLMRFRTGILI
ncbi:hypothetical protein OA90_27630 [Labrenzia sp. OB1]|nr:hypothetical protein OA90_27630 [Labrenzia sp. OB1]